MNPEFLREGSAVTDFREPDRIVIGSTDPESARALDALYARFTCPILHTSPGNAEMIKYAANTLLAALVSFSNEIAALCEALPGLDERTVMEGVHLDRRLSPVLDGRRLSPGLLSYLRAGPGYGGSCFPKDVTALGAFAAGLGVPVPLLEAIAATNRARPDQMLALLERVQPLAGRTVAVLGLAFKPGTDDVRESPGVKLVAGLLARGARVRAWDALARPLLPAGAAQAPGIAEALSGADAAIIATAWPELRAFDWAAAPALLARPLLLDARGVLEGVALPAGLTVLTVGRAPAP
jgi:UDPglucose 6-dehydrogenase/GDP-mannose 6-dehydrogenase